jgi:hypothetical protein
MFRLPFLAAALALAPLAAPAATFYLDGTIGGSPTQARVLNGGRAAFDAAISGLSKATEGFDTAALNGTLVNDAVFTSGIRIFADAASLDNNTFDGFIRLSTDNANRVVNGVSRPESPFTDTITITLPTPTSFVAFDFGIDGRGIGNNSGTKVTINGDEFNFRTQISGVNQDNGDFEGFFGYRTADPTVTFRTVTFAGLDLTTTFTDDDFTVDNVVYTPAPIPLPAGAWLLIGGLGTLGALRARRKS